MNVLSYMNGATSCQLRYGSSSALSQTHMLGLFSFSPFFCLTLSPVSSVSVHSLSMWLKASWPQRFWPLTFPLQLSFKPAGPAPAVLLQKCSFHSLYLIWSRFSGKRVEVYLASNILDVFCLKDLTTGTKLLPWVVSVETRECCQASWACFNMSWFSVL